MTRLVVATDQWSPDAVGGSARVATATAQQLAAAGNEVTAVSPSIAGLAAVDRSDGVELHRAIRRGPIPQSISDVTETWRWARRREPPEALMAHQATTAVGLALAHPRVPLLFVFHASAPLEERFIRRRSGGLRRAMSILLDPLLVVLERIAVRRATTIAVLSEYSRELLVARHPAARDRVALVRGGLDFDRFAGGDPARARVSQSLPDDIPFVLTVRRLEPRMGVEELLRATALLSQRGVRVTVGVAGAGPIGDRLRELSRTLGIDGHVRFFGRVPDEALPDLYAAADLFVLPTVAYEGFGISTIESLAAGTPVVGTPVGATPEILGPLEPRLLAEGTSPEQLAAAIEAGLASLSPALRRRCRDYAHSTYRWEAAIEPWKAALRRTIG